MDFLFYAQPLEGEAVVTKGVNSAFIGTELEEVVRRRGIRTLVIGGITTDQCVSTTARMAANLGVCEGGWGKVNYRTFLFSISVLFWRLSRPSARDVNSLALSPPSYSSLVYLTK